PASSHADAPIDRTQAIWRYPDDSVIDLGDDGHAIGIKEAETEGTDRTAPEPGGGFSLLQRVATLRGDRGRRKAAGADYRQCEATPCGHGLGKDGVRDERIAQCRVTDESGSRQKACSRPGGFGQTSGHSRCPNLHERIADAADKL